MMIERKNWNFKKSSLVISVLALTVLLLPITLAQTTPFPRGEIGVVGEGRVFVDPDTAITTLGVTITTQTLAEATSEANKRMEAVIVELQGLGVDDDDIQTVSYHISPRTDSSRGDESPKIVGYHVSNQVRVKVRNLDDVGKVIDGAIAAGANSVSGLSFTVDDPTPYLSEARELAVKAAMTKAGELAGAAGVKLGRITSLTEALPPQPILLERTSALAARPGVPIRTGQLEIAVRVEMHFEIEQP